MAALGTWTPLTLLAVILGYYVVVAALLLAPLITPVVREAWQARRAGRERRFVLFQPYPVYLLRFRRAFAVLLALPIFLAGAWLWVKMQ